jgi:anti-anti-sigma regulatory factor
MTCRVDRLIEADLTVLRISGRIAAQELEVLRAAVEEESGHVVIDLKDVGLIDGDAVRFLAIIEAKGGALGNCPPFIREWVNRERAQTRPDQSDA